MPRPPGPSPDPIPRTPSRPRAPSSPLRRRAFVLGGLLAAAGGASACTGPAEQPEGSGPRSTPPPGTTPTAPLPASPAVEPLPDVPPYALLAGEVEPACKQAAVDFVTAVLTAGTASTASASLPARLAGLGQPLAPASPLLALVPRGGASALEVVYPQYGGITDDRTEASVMLVADQLVRPAGAGAGVVERRSTTVDVRLSARGGPWTVVEVLPAVTPVAAPALSPAASALLVNDRVVLPAAARADVAGGGVADVVLTALAVLSQRWRVHVQVLTGGHPVNVFATDRVSNHTIGKAVDVWALDGVPVIDRARCPWPDLMRAGRDAGATEVGGPQDQVGEGFFSDDLHQDHVHLGFGRA